MRTGHQPNRFTAVSAAPKPQVLFRIICFSVQIKLNKADKLHDQQVFERFHSQLWLYLAARFLYKDKSDSPPVTYQKSSAEKTWL